MAYRSGYLEKKEIKKKTIDFNYILRSFWRSGYKQASDLYWDTKKIACTKDGQQWIDGFLQNDVFSTDHNFICTISQHCLGILEKLQDKPANYKELINKANIFGALEEIRSCFKFDKIELPAPLVQFLDENEKELRSLLFGDSFGNFNIYRAERTKAVWNLDGETF